MSMYCSLTNVMRLLYSDCFIYTSYISQQMYNISCWIRKEECSIALKETKTCRTNPQKERSTIVSCHMKGKHILNTRFIQATIWSIKIICHWLSQWKKVHIFTVRFKDCNVPSLVMSLRTLSRFLMWLCDALTTRKWRQLVKGIRSTWKKKAWIYPDCSSALLIIHKSHCKIEL